MTKTAPKKSLAKKIALTLGAAAIATTASLAGTSDAEAKSKFKIDLHFGGGYHGAHVGYGYGYRAPCRFFKRRWHKTGKYKWKKRYFRCMNRHYYYY